MDRGFVTDPEPITEQASTSKPKKKAKGLGKLWRMMTGHGKDSDAAKDQTGRSSAVDDDLSQPLAPPPPMNYLVNGRGDHMPHTKHGSSPSLSNGLATSFPRLVE